MRALGKNALMFIIGGALYLGLELLWRGYTHGAMFFLGGLCFLLIGSLDRRRKLPVLLQMFLGGLIITALELQTGLLFNRNLQIWNYTDTPLNFMGQVCLPFALFWFVLSGMIIVLDDALRHLLFGEARPQYRWIL
jgi:uncharacterized membrane protein